MVDHESRKVSQSFLIQSFLLMAASMLALLMPVLAQQTTGNVRGVVKDPTGAVVPNAKVTILDQKTNTSQNTTGTNSGEYEFKNLPVGDYQVTVEASGFKTLTLNEVRVQLNQTTDVTANLEVGITGEVVEVSAGGAELVDTTTTNLAKSFSERQVVDLAQTATGAGIYNLALVAANVSSSGGVGVGTGGSVGGQRPRNNNFVVDGIDNNDKSVTGPQVYISPESVSEFSLLANQYSAEFARSTGGQFITVTKSGTNDFHGTAYGFFRNRHWNAIDTQDKLAGITNCYRVGDLTCKPRDDYGRFGGNIGGPLYLPRFGEGGRPVIGGKDRLFFFAGYERLQTGSAAGAAAIQTPTALGFTRLGTIAGLSANNLAIFRQYTPVAPTQNGTDAITVNGVSIPVGFVNVPSPNFSYNNYVVANIDFTQSDRTQHRARFNFNQNRTIDTAATLPSFFLLVPFDTRLFSYTLTHAFTSKLTNETRIAYRRSVQDISAGDFQYPGLDQFPNIQLNDLGINIGPNPNAPQFGFENNYQIVNNLSYFTGNHSTKFGIDARKIISPQSFVQRQRGDYTYNSTETFLRDISPEFAERSVGVSPYYGDQILTFAYAQDDWRIRPNLTLNLGVNYAWQQVPFSARQQSINAVSSVPGLLEFREPKSQKRNFAPRVGFAYSPGANTGVMGYLFGSGGKSSIRAGFSMAYDVIFDNLYILSLPPQFTQTRNAAAGTANFLAGGGISPVPNPITDPTVAKASTSAYIPDQEVPYSMTYTLSFQRQFAQDWSFETRYLGTRGVHLLTQNRINARARVDQSSFLPTFFSAPTQTQIDALTLTRSQLEARSPIVPAYEAAGFDENFITAFLSNGNSSYHALSTQLNRRLSNGWQATAAYTWSHLIDDTTAEVFSTVLSPRRVQDFQNLRAERANSALDRRHRFVVSSVYDLPFFTNSTNWFARSILGGFSFAGTYSWETGPYATVRSGVDSNLNFDNAGDRAILNPNGVQGTASTVTPLLRSCPAPCTLTTAQRTVGYLATNPNAQYIQAGVGALATAGRNTLQLPGINNLDFSIFKNFQLYENVKIQLRADLYNALNHAQYTPGSVNGVEPIGVTSSPATSLLGIGLNPTLFNRPNLVFSSHPRVIQLALRLNF
jgi:Carboxypeptidase regulatory-like domain